MRILIIEDEIKTAAYLAKGLSENGFASDISHDGASGLFQISQQHYDLVVLDVMLPKLDGWQILTEIRRNFPQIRTLMLTARDSLEDRVKGLELGADDYLAKPFAFSELLARIRSVLRRANSNAPTELIIIADLQIDVLRHKASRNGQRLDLTQKEFALLVLLAQHRGEVLSRTLIAERVWDINFDSDTNVIDVAIRRLRQKVDDNFDITLIHTIRGVGYVLEQRQES